MCATHTCRVSSRTTPVHSTSLRADSRAASSPRAKVHKCSAAQALTRSPMAVPRRFQTGRCQNRAVSTTRLAEAFGTVPRATQMNILSALPVPTKPPLKHIRSQSSTRSAVSQMSRIGTRSPSNRSTIWSMIRSMIWSIHCMTFIPKVSATFGSVRCRLQGPYTPELPAAATSTSRTRTKRSAR